MGLLRLPFLLQTTTEYLIQERSFTLQISDIVFLIGLRGSSLGKDQLPIDSLPEYLSDSLTNAINNNRIFLPSQQVMLSHCLYATL